MVQFHPQITLLLVGGGAALSLALAVLAWRARQRTGDVRLAYVALAFAVFCLKGLVTMYSLAQDAQGGPFGLTHGHVEFVGSALDLLIMVLLVVPFLVRKP